MASRRKVSQVQHSTPQSMEDNRATRDCGRHGNDISDSNQIHAAGWLVNHTASPFTVQVPDRRLAVVRREETKLGHARSGLMRAFMLSGSLHISFYKGKSLVLARVESLHAIPLAQATAEHSR